MADRQRLYKLKDPILHSLILKTLRRKKHSYICEVNIHEFKIHKQKFIFEDQYNEDIKLIINFSEFENNKRNTKLSMYGSKNCKYTTEAHKTRKYNKF